jgi:hypothetical protein
VGTVALLSWANAQPHVSALGEEGPAPSCSSGTPLDQAQAAQRVATSFPAASVTAYKTITRDTLALVRTGDQSGAQDRITDLETAWDDDQPTLQPKDCRAWTFVDRQIDPALSAVRDPSPDRPTEEKALSTLLSTLG